MEASKRALLLAGAALFAAAPALGQPSQSGAPGTLGHVQAESSLPGGAKPIKNPRQTGLQGGQPAGRGIEEVIVTAQKRKQSANSVGESITALSSAALGQRGINTVADLVKAVPGFNYTPSFLGTPVFFLRGVGVYETGFGTSPAVSVYTDEVPIPYPVMQEGVGLDLQRVEVLKGPQGTLFGENSTGGAINYIAAKPTDHYVSGGDITVARFGEVDLDTYAAGPITDTLKGRLSLATDQGGAWQQSQSRPGDELGDKRFYQGRLLLDWKANDDLSVKVNLNGFYDNDQNQAPQLKFIPAATLNAALPYPLAHYAGNPNVPADIYTGPLTPLTVPRPAPDDARAADWSQGFGDDRRNNGFEQGSVRADYQLRDQLMLTSITSFDNVNIKNYVPLSGTGLPLENIETFGSVTAFNQEVRLAGNTSRLNWVLGSGYSYTNSQEHDTFSLPGILFSVFDTRGLDKIGLLPPSLAGLYHVNNDTSFTRQAVNDYSVFGNVEYKILPDLTVQGGLRFTQDDRKAHSCEYYTSPGNPWGNVFEALQGLLGKKQITFIGAGQCLVLDSHLNPGPVDSKLNQNNLSWRFGLNYKLPGSGVLVYANNSRGFKSGEVPTVGASSASQFTPITQERLDAYEVGFKAPLANRAVQLNGAGFFYDYRNKQVLGNVDDPVFGELVKLISVPKSQVYGFEGSLDARPLPDLTTSIGATYLHSEVTSPFQAVAQNNTLGNFNGSELPYTPKLTITADVQYDWRMFEGYQAFVGASVLHHSKSNATFQTSAISAPEFALPSYTTLDLRVGIGPDNGRWRLSIFGRNVTNAYYLNGNYTNGNERFVYTGLPTVYGATLSLAFQ